MNGKNVRLGINSSLMQIYQHFFNKTNQLEKILQKEKEKRSKKEKDTYIYSNNIREEKKNKEKTESVVKEKPHRTRKEFVPPTYEEVLEYARSRGREDLARKFFDYFDTGEWIDSKGNKVRNWKQKFITWESNNEKGANNADNLGNNSRSTSEVFIGDGMF